MSFADFLTRLQKGKPIPPPAAPPPLNLGLAPFELPVPFALEEFPRTFLHLLMVSGDLSPQTRAMVEAFLTDFDSRLMDYLNTTYGEGVSQVAAMISQNVMDHQSGVAEQRAAATEREVLTDLEKRLAEDDQ